MLKKMNNMRYLSLFLMLLPLGLTSCATANNPAIYYPQAPVPEHFEPSYQKQLNASAHWGVIASDLSDQLQSALAKNSLLEKPVFLNLYSEKTEFSKAFQDFLTTHLVKKGILVSKNKLGSTIYNYKVQPVTYQSRRTTMLPSNLKWTTLAAGIIVVRNLADSLHLNEDILTAGIAADAWLAEQAPTLELIITSSILSHDIYIYRTTDVYYANGSDMHLYQHETNAGRKHNVFDDPFYKTND